MCSAQKQEQLIPAIESALKEYFTENAQASDDYGRIVNARHFARVTGTHYGVYVELCVYVCLSCLLLVLF